MQVWEVVYEGMLEWRTPGNTERMEGVRGVTIGGDGVTGWGGGDCDECEAAKIRACEGWRVKMRVSAAIRGVKVRMRRKWRAEEERSGGGSMNKHVRRPYQESHGQVTHPGLLTCLDTYTTHLPCALLVCLMLLFFFLQYIGSSFFYSIWEPDQWYFFFFTVKESAHGKK